MRRTLTGDQNCRTARLPPRCLQVPDSRQNLRIELLTRVVQSDEPDPFSPVASAMQPAALIPQRDVKAWFSRLLKKPDNRAMPDVCHE
jgi:hypothetical protein